MSEPPFDLSQAHRWFAIESNNAAWDLLEKSDRKVDEEQQLLDAAHAARLHWREVGGPLNALRAESLLTSVYVSLGRGASALAHAQRCLDLSREHAAEQTTFDEATALSGYAQACFLCGRTDDAQQYKQQAQQVGDQLDAEEKPVFDQIFAAVDWKDI